MSIFSLGIIYGHTWVSLSVAEFQLRIENGAQVDQDVASRGPIDYGNGATLTIGRVHTSWFNGLLDDIRIYDSVLSPLEIQDLYSAEWNSTVPLRIVNSGVKKVSAWGSTAHFIKDDNSLWALGSNPQGQLGIGNQITQYSPGRFSPRNRCNPKTWSSMRRSVER